MQAIERSNEHLDKAKTLWDKIENEEKESAAYLEAQFAEIKAQQAIAHAISYLGDMIHNLGVRLK